MKATILVLSLCAVILLVGCTAAKAEPKTEPKTDAPVESAAAQELDKGVYQRITPEDAKKMMDEGNVTIVDVRTESEYNEAHIPGAVLVPVESIGSEPPEALADKDATLLVYCRSGNRSRTASEKLIELGYTSVYDFGGIKDWPYETEAGGNG